ncbi:MAG TPA: thrombospondin type 3 repeat-containing protein [Myxococcota bacterium]|nr:thrombospondin type 3 repeat-containing protein [Myxococcota bacterium]
MVALRLFSLLLAVGFALPAHAFTFPYEQLGIGGKNNITDSNSESCDNSPFPINGTSSSAWAGPGEGCYTRTGAKCSANPAKLCDLQAVPNGRCTYGDLNPGGGNNQLNSCVWPHGAGRCRGNNHVGCLSDQYVADGVTVASGTSSMCTGTGDSVCDMTTDPYGGTFRTSCTCQGDDPNAPNFETTVCGTATGTVKAICSDGDPDRDTGGYGTGLGVELNLGTGNVSFANMGPSQDGSLTPDTSPPYGLEAPASNDAVEPQRAPGTVNRTVPTVTAIVRARVTDARSVDPTFNSALGVTKVVNFGDSYWADWAFASVNTTGTFNTHIVVFSCDPKEGFKTDVTLDGTHYCSQLGRDGVTFQWSRDLTPSELTSTAGHCPPNCLKDFDITTTEIEAFNNTGLIDPHAGAQLAIQSGEGRQAGGGDAIGAAVVTSHTWLITNDMRCKMGGWGDPNAVGRCSDGPLTCVPGAAGDTACAGQGGSCRACNGPYDATTNPLSLPIGYNQHSLPELDLVAQHRIGGIGGVPSQVRVPLFVVGTTGFAASDFRDLPTSGQPADLADMGLVDTSVGADPFAVGVGTGGTFTNGSTLDIGETCCLGGADISWAPDQVGDPVTVFNRTFDRGPGPDGIPGCMGDNSAVQNGLHACVQHLGKGVSGAKSDGFYATGKDDQPTTFAFPGRTIPASQNRYNVKNALPSVVTYFSNPPYSFTSPNPTSVNTVAAFPFRDIKVLTPLNTDILVKVNTSFCPIVGGSAVCTLDSDGDGIPDILDNCPTVANATQTDTDGDGVGDACDNCVNIANPRVTPNVAAYLNTNQWATLTGGQRDDDHDGYGNKCDGKFPGTLGTNVGASDLAQFRASNGKSRLNDNCGTVGTHPCAIFDLDEGAAASIGAPDLAQFRALNGKAPGPKCPTCPLTCTSGTAGTCGPIP